MKAVRNAINKNLKDFVIFGTVDLNGSFIFEGAMAKFFDVPPLGFRFNWMLADDNKTMIITLSKKLKTILEKQGIRCLNHIGSYENMWELFNKN